MTKTRKKSKSKAVVPSTEYPTVKGEIVSRCLSDVTEQYATAYGKEVVEDRAVPDYRDGLKPVHRAILWAMYDLKLHNKGGVKKAARTVGDVIGRFHPHGDSACYGAMVTIANTKPNLVHGQGNWGDVTSGAAAQRYCFAAGTRLMTEKGLVPIEDIPGFSSSDDPEEYLYTDKYRIDIDTKMTSLKEAKKASHWINSGYQDTWKITTSLGYAVTCTENQPLYVLTASGYEWKTIAELNVGDKVSMRRGSDIYPESSHLLPTFNWEPEANNAVVCTLPSEMSEELAFILGTLVAEGYGRDWSFGFNTSYRSVYTKFMECWEIVFPDCPVRVSKRPPHGYGKRTSMYVSVNSTHVAQYLQSLGLLWGSHNIRIPECIFRASKEEAAAFFSGLFDGDGSISNLSIEYHSKSIGLLEDVQALLLAYFGVYSSRLITGDRLRISGVDNTSRFFSQIPFVSRKNLEKSKDFMSNASATMGSRTVGGNSSVDCIPVCFRDATRAKAFGRKMSDVRRVPSTTWKFKRVALEYAEDIKQQDVEFSELLHDVCGRDYLYEEIIAIETAERQWVYDLTVPDTHAFTANGFIAHNTEAKLSEFSDRFLLHPDYLAVTPMVPNFSDDYHMPLFLPCRVPLQLIMGSPLAPAFGVRCGTLPLEYKGVMKCVQHVLQGEKLSSKMLLKYLKPNLEWGGEYVGTKQELLEYFKTGKAGLKFRPEILVDEDKKTITIISGAPGFSSGKSVLTKSNTISKIDGVTKVKDVSSKKSPGNYGFEVIVYTGRISDDKFGEVCDKVYKTLTVSSAYDIGYTQRRKTDTRFGRMAIVKFLETWCKYLVRMEKKVLQTRRDVQLKKLEAQERLIFAVDNREVILKSLSSNDPDKYLVKHLKISPEMAKAILDLQVRRLAKLERTALVATVKKIKTEIKRLEKFIKKPADHILDSFDETYFDYLKKTKDNV